MPIRPTYDDLFPTSDDDLPKHLRVSIVKKSDVKGTSDLLRVQTAPSTAAIVTTASPTWKDWVHNHLLERKSYILRKENTLAVLTSNVHY